MLEERVRRILAFIEGEGTEGTTFAGLRQTFNQEYSVDELKDLIKHAHEKDFIEVYKPEFGLYHTDVKYWIKSEGRDFIHKLDRYAAVPKQTNWTKWGAIFGAIAVTITTISFLYTYGIIPPLDLDTKSPQIITPQQPETNEPLDSRNLYDLPAPAVTPSGWPSSEVYLTSVSNQKFVARPLQTITLTARIQYSTGENPSQFTQALFLPSWSTSWPPGKNYYFPLFDEIPILAPGEEREIRFSFVAPEKAGTYYLWLAMASYYNIEDAANSFKSKPHLPAHIKFIVEEI